MTITASLDNDQEVIEGNGIIYQCIMTTKNLDKHSYPFDRII